MKDRLNTIAITSTALLLGLAMSGSLLAQQSGADMPRPGKDRASCSEVQWHSDLMAGYPWVAEACHEAIVVNGEKWARFEAEFLRMHQDGMITAEFKNDRGRSLGNVDLIPGPNQRVLLDGRSTSFSDLRRGQMLNFYAPEGEFSFATEPGARPGEQIRISQRDDAQRREDLRLAEQRALEQRREEQRLAEQRRDEQRRADESRTQLAQAPRATTQRASQLPATAGPLPLMALGGLLSLLSGITLTARRRLNRHCL